MKTSNDLEVYELSQLSKERLEEICDLRQPVIFNYSVDGLLNECNIDILEKNNYVYDSSVVPAKTSLYGIPNAATKPYKITSNSLESNSTDGKILEFPLLVTKFY